MRIAILCNPAAGRVGSRLPEIRALCRQIAGDSYMELDGAALDGTGMGHILAVRPDLLVIIAGDGTLHGVLTRLFEPGHPVPVPAVLVVPAGTTNMSALDIGIRETPVAVLKRLRNRLAQQPGAPPPGRVCPVLRIERASSPPLCGMFFGAGIIARGVGYFADHVRGRGITGEIASALVLGRFLGALIGPDSRRLTAPVHAQLEGFPGCAGRRPYLAILATVLDRLLLGMRPYWGGQVAPIHATAVGPRPARMYRNLPGLLRGRGEGLRPEDGYASANVDSLVLTLDGPFVIDGQCYEAGGEKLTLGVAGNVNFVIP
ncbi:MAG: hypothetical protein HYR49_03470 [Gammaproteobacteria bacterium]|nr:hypothetical protein [Gammaproteobacteria bacterium]